MLRNIDEKALALIDPGLSAAGQGAARFEVSLAVDGHGRYRFFSKRKAHMKSAIAAVLATLAIVLSVTAVWGQVSAEEAYRRLEARRAAASTQPATAPTSRPVRISTPPASQPARPRTLRGFDSLLRFIPEKIKLSDNSEDFTFNQAAEEITSKVAGQILIVSCTYDHIKEVTSDEAGDDAKAPPDSASSDTTPTTAKPNSGPDKAILFARTWHAGGANPVQALGLKWSVTYKAHFSAKNAQRLYEPERG